MSSNVYGPQDGPAPDFLRNTYDKQFQNLITTNFGELRPCFCKEVLPGDSVNIDPVVAIRSQPIVFPIQTRMKFYCHFFYGRNRILMKDWEDFIFNTKDGITPPLLKLTQTRAKKMISTGSLGDNLGVVSTYANDSAVVQEISFDALSGYYVKNIGSSFSSSRTKNSVNNRLITYIDDTSHPLNTAAMATPYNVGYGYLTGVLSYPFSSSSIYSKPFVSTAELYTEGHCLAVFLDSDNVLISLALDVDIEVVQVRDKVQLKYTINDSNNPDVDFVSLSKTAVSDYGSFKVLFFSIKDELDDDHYNLVSNAPYFPSSPTSDDLVPQKLLNTIVPEGVLDATDGSIIESNKFVGDNPAIPLSALPFRLYEFICNYYYRNDTNNPYVLNGEPQYNVFIPTTDSGWDTNEYLIHHRNWESDMFTTCVPSPQFGTAPLVGLTYNGGLTANVTANVTDSDGVTQQLGIQVGVDDGGNITSIIDADTGVPSGSLKSLMDAMSTTGISINTLRNVNSFQRFLENVIRRGLRYRNQLLSHFGVSVDYPDIDIPQFIGGFSGDLVVREVTNMAESAEVALGDVAGKIDAVIQSNHSINCYCAEHGFIMGIFCIVPVPTYSQVLPNMFTRYSAFDYFQKEFDKIGYVPVTYRNFLPLQASNPDEVFGYQRAWYEYMSSLDEVHGDFRLTLDDFVLYRIFREKPTLNESFLKVDSDSLNNIFAVDKIEGKYKDADKFMCQFYFQYSHKNMIPKHGVASLE